MSTETKLEGRGLVFHVKRTRRELEASGRDGNGLRARGT